MRNSGRIYREDAKVQAYQEKTGTKYEEDSKDSGRGLPAEEPKAKYPSVR